ncbi:hypothetical protein MVES1_003007 [Malassezia vespertilionis]|uniref:Uncharacterized protein n=1 Tax=Malassezia vespertilionis TaxID=2020962 RepID=A0A2N1J9L7_9BASI|nr:uncharacterized protein MVES1_003007 [Malassezia vespertilionis]PKI83243.1 hypothetical protein MVES_002847 [Malassezia vespertilionis]WFD07638.1 hypothetical protein MVES1_003007 [Malassezia vespertilionis]
MVLCRSSILQRQRQYQNSEKPVYLRLPRSKLYFGTFLAIFWTGIFGISAGCLNMIKGKKAT